MHMPINFDEFYSKAQKVTHATTQMELANLLGVNRSAITQAKNRNAVPEKWLFIIAKKFSLSSDWFENGLVPTKSNLKAAESKISAFLSRSLEALPEVIQIPKVSARLCAGGGSFDVDSAIIDHMAMPFAFARGLGNPSEMILMDVMGNSMEPNIYHGDTVLIDQSATEIKNDSVMAVGYEDSIYIKRMHKNNAGGVDLLSDNADYSPIQIYGDELQSFRVIGKLVWLCRKV